MMISLRLQQVLTTYLTLVLMNGWICLETQATRMSPWQWWSPRQFCCRCPRLWYPAASVDSLLREPEHTRLRQFSPSLLVGIFVFWCSRGWVAVLMFCCCCCCGRCVVFRLKLAFTNADERYCGKGQNLSGQKPTSECTKTYRHTS